MKKSNHARLQSIMNRFNPSIPEPCCVPDKMMPLSILFFDSENRDHIVLKVFPNMAVASCACRWLAAFKFCLYKCILSILYILYTIYQNAMWLIQIYQFLLKWVIINDSIRPTTQNEGDFFHSDFSTGETKLKIKESFALQTNRHWYDPCSGLPFFLLEQSPAD